MSSASAKLDALILCTERAAIAKAMCGLWTDADDAHLAALYVERHCLLEKAVKPLVVGARRVYPVSEVHRLAGLLV